MNSKESPGLLDLVLELLRENIGQYVSGAEIAERLSVSRNAIWKAMEKLRLKGYVIDAMTNRGYRLVREVELLDAEKILSEIHPAFRDKFQIEIHSVLASTNDTLRRRAELDENGELKEGLVLFAEMQRKGKGRVDRYFHSPAHSGLYMSLFLRPTIPAPDALLITTAAAVAVARAVESCVGIEAKIKWVNDIFVGGKKAAGILTEASLNIETGQLDYAVLGIGVNIFEPLDGWPVPLMDVATSLLPEHSERSGMRNKIAGTILQKFWEYYRHLSKRPFLGEYRRRLLIQGKKVYIDDFRGKEPRLAEVLGVDEDFRLLVRYSNGQKVALSSGEVTLRPYETFDEPDDNDSGSSDALHSSARPVKTMKKKLAVEETDSRDPQTRKNPLPEASVNETAADVDTPSVSSGSESAPTTEEDIVYRVCNRKKEVRLESRP